MRCLVLLTDGFGGHGGIAKFNRDFLEALCMHPDSGEVVAVPRLMPEPPGELPARLRYVTRGLDSKLRFVLASARVALSRPPCQFLVCAHINLLPIAWLCRRLMGRARMLLIVHGTDAWKPTPSSLCNALARRVEAFVAVSHLTRERFRSWTGLPSERGHVLPNCIDLARFTPGPRPPALVQRYGLGQRTVMMSLGRLDARERYKGVDELLELMPELGGAVPALTYLVVGDGSDRARLEQKARTLGLADRVVFAGNIPEAEKVAHYRLADAFVMPGRGEGFGIVYLEAMACGVPVVASQADASREAVGEGRLGLAVNPDDPSEIKAAVLQCLARPRGVRPTGLEEFSRANFMRRVHALIGTLMESPLPQVRQAAG